MYLAASRCPPPPMTPPSPPDRKWTRSPSPPILPSVRRRRLWSPPMRRRSPAKSQRSRSSAASSTAPRLVRRPRPPSPDAADALDFRPPSRSRRLGHRSHHDSRPPSKTSLPNDVGDDRGRLQRRSPSPSPSTATSSPPQTPPPDGRLQSVLLRPPRTRHGNCGSRFVALTILSTTQKRAQASPPTTTDIMRINRKLRALAL